MAEKGFKRKLTAILSADVVGYSSLMDDDEAETIRTLKNHCSAITTLIGHNRGRVVDIIGDNLLAEFSSAVDALNCGTEIQQELALRNMELPDNRKMEFRIGINVGDVVEENGRIYGDGVNIAARIESLSGAGGICISGRVYDQVENKLDLKYDFLGEQKVKNIARPIRVYVVKLADDVTESEMGKKHEPPAKPSIAVLPFLNMSGEVDQEYFSDGITEDIITALSKFRWFFVIARNSSFTYKGKTMEVRQVAEDLGVRYVLEGSVRKAGKKVRITAQLIDAPTGYHIWAERYDRDLEDIFAVQDEITHNIVRSVGPEFLSAEMKRAQRKDALNLDVWDYIMRASSHHSRYTKKDAAEAQRLLFKAIELDPMSSEAFCLLAFTHLMQVQFGWSESTTKSIKAAEKAAQSAVAIDDRDAWAHTALGLVNLISKRYDDAVCRLENAIDLNPNLANAYGALGQALALAGEYEAAVTHINKAIRLSPHDPFAVYWFGHLGVAAFADERYEDACYWGRKTIQQNPNFPGGHRLVAASCGQLDRTQEAANGLKELLFLMPGMAADDVRKQVPFKRSIDMERYIDGLRKAGLKE
ncbi:MAG: tetratricopeptide repeat protein [Desulfobacteraceae bacterium]|nr:tetratricopeptide repeat protein [Desulfobacteraceae bacterium]MDH3839213.1 tetratricopeptide repeat protein [Desulfobacteraceae bacterium]